MQDEKNRQGGAVAGTFVAAPIVEPVSKLQTPVLNFLPEINRLSYSRLTFNISYFSLFTPAFTDKINYFSSSLKQIFTATRM